MIDKFLNFSIKMKICIVLINIIVIGVVVGGIIYFNTNRQANSLTASSKTFEIEEEIILEVKEESIVVAKDTTIDEALVEKEEEVVKFKDKEVKVPKSKVSSVNSAEDAETNKKNGGSAVSQEQAETMFENVGQKSMGIDVSHHQGRINWAKVKESGVDFAMIRVGYRGQSSGGIYEDAYFKTNVTGAVANGIKVGIYFYSTAINETEALEEAAWVVKKIAPYRITYPVVYDFEDFNSKRCANVGGAEATKNALAFLSYVKSNGYEPMMYASKNDITNKMSRSSFSCKFWLAHYTSQTDYKGSYNMWQYTSKGSVPGISGNTDMNIAYFNYGTVAEPKHTHDYKEEVKNSLVEPTCLKNGSKTMRCSCGESQTTEIPKLKHEFGEWKTTKEPTKNELGEETRICTLCKKEKETRKLSKENGNTNTNLTGNITNTNSIGNNTNTNTNANINTNTNTNTNTNANTNTNTNTNTIVNNTNTNTTTNTAGNNTNTSTNTTGNTTNTTGGTGTHEEDFSVFVSKEDPTCYKDGKEIYKCSKCDKTKETILEKTGNHILEEGKCTTDGCTYTDPNYQPPNEDESPIEGEKDENDDEKGIVAYDI